jgi:hypothetical protein
VPDGLVPVNRLAAHRLEAAVGKRGQRTSSVRPIQPVDRHHYQWAGSIHCEPPALVVVEVEAARVARS